MVKYFSAIIALAFFATSSLYAQSWQDNLKEGKQLYINKIYPNAQTLFQKAANQIREESGTGSRAYEEAEGYRLLCAIKLSQKGAESQAGSYIRMFPSSPLVPKVRFAAASSYFAKEDYGRALSLMEELQPSDIDKDERDRYLLEKGVCLMKDFRTVEAENHFMEIPESSKLYGQAQYYLGYSEYQEGNFADALNYFLKSDHPKVPLMVADCHFMLKDYLYVCENASEINKYEGAEKAHFARIISESAYAYGLKSDAEHYFKIYAEQKELSKADNFFSGMLSYEQGNWREAAGKFQKCIEFGDDDSLTQNALYRLARCMIEEKDKVSAADAFKKAAQMNFNPEVKEDAFFNYAKLSFDLWGTADRLYEYLENYPSSQAKQDETFGYIATKCLEDNRFQDAITALEKISSPTVPDKKNLQKAYFFRGIEFMNDGRYSAAAEFLDKAADQDSDIRISNLSDFWLAESYFRTEKYREALDVLERLQAAKLFKGTGEYPVSYFNSGYARFRLKDLGNAYRDFSKYLELAGADGRYSLEAKMRMADCKFMQRDFAQASKLYSSLSQKTADSNLYAPLQEAICQGLMGNTKKKLEILGKYASDHYSGAAQYTELLFELGKTRLQSSDSKGAETVFRSLVDNPSDSTYYGRALMELGMLYANQGSSSKAKECYRKAAESDLSPEEIQAAMNAYQNICNEEGNPDEFFNWVSSRGKNDSSGDNNAKLLFNAAEQIFLAEKYDAAAEAFKSFIAEYPDYNPSKSWYYLAESLSQTADYSGAAKAYSHLLSLASDNGDGRLMTLCTGNEVKMLYLAKEYNKIIERSSELMESHYSPESTKQFIAYYIAKSYLAMGEADKAIEPLKFVAESTEDEVGGEAAYLLVKDAYDRGRFEKVENMVFELSEQEIDRTWLAKCYLILGDSYFDQEDYEQAAAVFKSIASSYDGDDAQIKEIAKARAQQAEKMKKK
ncbi:MAG: tetratricopeptide repeat protein [Bacteroidales bacterium]|nr:tetratricopeptide repeat protein [Bacteroidales bacterium]